MGSQLNHAQSANNMMATSVSSEPSNNNNYNDHEHKQNESMDSSFSAQSTQSAPSYNNNNYNNNYNQQPPPSAYSTFNASKSLPKRSRQLSEGQGPRTGAPEIVGDISSWKAQQNENEQKYQQQQQQNDYNAYPKLSDGAPQTGGAYNPRLHQSRTSATGQQHPQFNAISGIQNNYNRKQSYEHNPILQSAANDNQNEII